MIQTRTKRLRTAVAASAALALAVTAGGAPPAQATSVTESQFVAYTVGGDGRLYATTLSKEPTLANEAKIAPPGAGVTAIRQSDGNIAVFSIGTEGGLVVGVTTSGGPELEIFTEGPGELAPPGAQVNAVSGPDGVHVFFAGHDGAIYTMSYAEVVEPGTGGEPQAATEPDLAPPGAVIAAAQPTASPPGASFIGKNGGLWSVWRVAEDSWETVPASTPDMAPPGGGVAATPTDEGLSTFFTGYDGRLWNVAFKQGPLPEPWEPQPISEAGAAPAGAHLAAARYTDGPMNVYFAGHDGAIQMMTDLAGEWSTPSPTTTPAVASPGGSLSLSAMNDIMLVGWCGNDLLYWLRKKFPPPIPPDPGWGELTIFKTGNLIQAGFHISTAPFG